MAITTDPSLPPERPTRARLVVLALLCGMSFVLYLDRVCISQAVDLIQTDLDLSGTRMALVLMAFTLAYGLFEVPTGRWGDRYGSRRVLTRIALWWSAFTALTGACPGFFSLLLVRFLFGAGEAGAFPNAARVMSRWFAPHEQGRARGLFLASSYLGGVCAPLLAAPLIRYVGWRLMFVAFAGFGVAWAAGFAWWFRDDPARHPAVNDAELDAIGTAPGGRPLTHEPIPWGEVLRHPAIWLLGTIITFAAFNSYLYFSWYPKYLQKGRGLDQEESSWLAALVLTGALLGVLTGGLVVDLWRRLGVDPFRAGRVYCCAAVTAAAGAVWLGMAFESPWASAACAGLSCWAMVSQQPAWWGFAGAVSGRHLGALFGLMNGMGVVGALASQFFFGAFADWRQAQGYTGRDVFEPAFHVFAAVLLVAAVCWLFVDVSRPVGGGRSSRQP